MVFDQIVEADWTWTGEGFEPGVRVAIDADGQIVSVGADLPSASLRLTGRALLPGFVNAHSHAFQRGLRGRGERFSGGEGSFWSWREEMYKLVASLDAARLFDLSRQAFSEMLAAGITTVGEFHYCHHDATGKGYDFDEVVLAAARETGIRIVLLNAYYRTGGVDQPLAGGQTRFRTESPRQYWDQMDRLGARLSVGQSLAAVVHSIRAAPLNDIREIREEAVRRKLPFHMHVEEQRREIEESRHHYGSNPLALLLDGLRIDETFTAVHCTHSSPSDLEAFLSAGGRICVCPLTEANLGDGVPDLRATRSRLCVGTDSNSRICFLEEVRWLEYVQRLKLEKRGVLQDEKGWVARRLLDHATVDGAGSLGVNVGEIRPGFEADLVAVDLKASCLGGWEPGSLLDSIVFGCGNRIIDAVCVGGSWRTVVR